MSNHSFNADSAVHNSIDGKTTIDRFLANPSEYFDYSLTKMMGLSREHLARLQLDGLKRRFEQFRGALPMVDKLADVQGINAINDLNDVLPLLFDHATYKSYPASLLEKRRFPQLTAWLNKLTTIDLSQVDVSKCRDIDDWMITLSRETPMAVAHTSGTSGTMSFLPWSKAEWRNSATQRLTVFFQRFGQDPSLPVVKPPANIDCIYPYFRHGGLSQTVSNNATVEIIAGGEERFHAAYPGRLSADLMLLAARLRMASAKGQKLEIDPDLLARRAEFESLQGDMPRHTAEFFKMMQNKLMGKRVYMLATTNLLVPLAQDGLKKGLRKVFSPDSVIMTGGGGKGLVLPDGWQEMVKEFLGVDLLNVCYGMSEMAGQFNICEHGNYHGVPWIIPFMLDPDTAKPLPRTGTVTGRFAFYDLLFDTHWGGFITGDEVTLTWDEPCPCGRTTPYVDGNIQRYSEKRNSDGDEKISCASTPGAYEEALDFLNADSI